MAWKLPVKLLHALAPVVRVRWNAFSVTSGSAPCNGRFYTARCERSASATRSYQPLLHDRGKAVSRVEWLDASNANDIVLDGDERWPEKLKDDAATRRRLKGTKDEAAAGLGARATDQSLHVPFVRPCGCPRPLGQKHASAAKKMDARDHRKLYIYPVFCADAMAKPNELGEQEWVIRCSARLHARWPRIGREQRDETAEELWRAGTWRELEPEQAAAAWIDLGAPAGGRPG